MRQCTAAQDLLLIEQSHLATQTRLADIELIAPLPIDIVIEGETGIGKDTLAKQIHQASKRTGPFIALNCAAVPEALAESELFGAEVGAYTGAVKSRQGYIEAADRGTLYLDEIDSMSLSLQAKLLRVLEERGVERLGSTKFKKVEFRVIASTKAPLNDLVDQGTFRQDLYFRLSVVAFQLEPLRKRRAEIVPLFSRFLTEACARLNRPPRVIDAQTEAQLLVHDWSGNIRELKSAADRFALGLAPIHSRAHLHAERADRSLKQVMHHIERSIIQSSLERWNGNMKLVSEELSIPERTLYHRLKILGINEPRR